MTTTNDDNLRAALADAERERNEARAEAATHKFHRAAAYWALANRERMENINAAEVVRLRRALARVEAALAPQWHANRGYEHDDTSSAYAAGRNDFIDLLRDALAGTDPTDTEGDDRD